MRVPKYKRIVDQTTRGSKKMKQLTHVRSILLNKNKWEIVSNVDAIHLDFAQDLANVDQEILFVNFWIAVIQGEIGAKIN